MKKEKPKSIQYTTMLEWAKTWKGIHPVVELTRQVYEKGVSLSKEAMQAVEARLKRNPDLPKWDILIRPPWYEIRRLAPFLSCA